MLLQHQAKALGLRFSPSINDYQIVRPANLTIANDVIRVGIRNRALAWLEGKEGQIKG
jgi:hypothetical protein